MNNWPTVQSLILRATRAASSRLPVSSLEADAASPSGKYGQLPMGVLCQTCSSRRGYLFFNTNSTHNPGGLEPGADRLPGTDAILDMTNRFETSAQLGALDARQGLQSSDSTDRRSVDGSPHEHNDYPNTEPSDDGSQPRQPSTRLRLNKSDSEVPGPNKRARDREPTSPSKRARYDPGLGLTGLRDGCEDDAKPRESVSSVNRPPRATVEASSSIGEVPGVHADVPILPFYVRNRFRPVGTFALIKPFENELYALWWPEDRRFYAVLVLPLGDLGLAGWHGTLTDTGLLNNLPYCYRNDDHGLIAWGPDFEDGGKLVTERKFPINFFDAKRSVGWALATELFPFPFGHPEAVVDYEIAVQHYAAIKGYKSFEDMEKHARA